MVIRKDEKVESTENMESGDNVVEESVKPKKTDSRKESVTVTKHEKEESAIEMPTEDIKTKDKAKSSTTRTEKRSVSVSKAGF